MTQWFERYTCPDLVVTDLASTLRVLVEKLGVPEVPPRKSTAEGYGIGFDIAMVPVNDDLNLTASVMQVLGLRQLRRGEPVNELGWEIQAMLLAYIYSKPLYRPIVSHVTSLRTKSPQHLDELAELLRSRSVPHMVRLGNVYVGLSDDSKGIRYDPSVDGGAQLEFASITYPGLLSPPEISHPPDRAQLPPGSLVRPTARTHLVESIPLVLERFRAMIDWPDDDDLHYTDGDGYRSVSISMGHPLGTVWELVAPTRQDSRAGLALAKFGEGAWANRIGVFGLGDKLDDLERHGVGWKALEDGPFGRRVALNRWDLGGLSLELEDLEEVIRGTGATRL